MSPARVKPGWLAAAVCAASLNVGVAAAWASSDPTSAIAAYVAEQLDVDASEIRVRTVSPDPANAASSGAKVIGVQEAKPGALLGRTAFVVRTAADNGRAASRVLSVDVERVGRVVMAARRLNRFHVIGAEDLEVHTALVQPGVDAVTDSPDALIGKRLTRSIGKNRPITVDAVEDPPVIQRGDRVTVRVRSGNLTILAIGRAKEDGRLGAHIPVANEESRKVVYGRVVDPGTVLVEAFGE
ncbi:MAG: flagellar basal body P-ring formation chaperone FlgA [Nitrospirota bacterium]